MRSSRRTSAIRRNSIAGRWRPWLWETPADETPDETNALSAEAAREQISLWADDTSPALGPSAQLRVE